MKIKNYKQKIIKSSVSEELHDKFHERVKQKYGNSRSATHVIRKLIIKYLQGEIKI